MVQAALEHYWFTATTTGGTAGAGPFTISVSGDGMDCSAWDCQITLDRDADGTRTFSDLQLQPPAGNRTIILTGYPPGGAQGNFQLDQVTSTSTNCTFVVLSDGTGNNKTKKGATVNFLQEGACVLEMHVH